MKQTICYDEDELAAAASDSLPIGWQLVSACDGVCD